MLGAGGHGLHRSLQVTGVQTFALVLLYFQSLAVIPGYGSRAECEAAQRMFTEVMRQDGKRGVSSYCVVGPVEVR